MKIKSKNIHRILLAVIVLTAIIFTRCNKYDDLGMELLPSTDLITVKNVIIKDDISANTILEDSIRTDSPLNSLLGVVDDPVFGETTIDFASQFRLLTFPDYGENPVADSVFLYLYYYRLYGDTTTTQRIKVYELEESIFADYQRNDSSGTYSDYPYYQDVDLKSMASDVLLGDMEFVPRVSVDTSDLGVIDTSYQLLRVPLDISLAEKLVSADSLDMVNSDAFLNYFKGLYIETEKVGDGAGTILSLEAARNSSFQGSAVVVYYNNDENLNDEEPDTLSMPYIITANSARVNHIEHDYTGTAFIDNLNSENLQDSLLYVQSTGGLEIKLDIDNLGTWKDSVNTAINKAELIFKVDTAASELGILQAPSRLLFTVIDSTGNEYLPEDYIFSSSYYGGGLDKEDYTYRFNITQHLQQIIDGERKNNGFKLTTAFKNNEYKRVVLKGSNSDAGVQLIITYSKFLQ